MREKLNIPEDRLRVCLQEQYDISEVKLEFLPLGLDTRAGVYRVLSEQGTSYFLKAKSGPFYEPGCLVPRYLRDQGITAVVAPLPTKRNTLWTQVGDWKVIVYPFIAGDTGLHLGMTDENWQEVGKIFKQIHQVPLPSSGFRSLRKETFDPTEYARWIHAFETQLASSSSPGKSKVEYALRSYWVAHQPTIHTLLTFMEELADVLQKRTLPYVICHADLHANNTLLDQADHLFVIDWDDVMLAPRERDFIFVREALANSSTRQEPSPFFQGYGQTEIDWVALTYYQCERAVSDLIECAQEVFFRDDLGEESKADAVQLFSDLFAENNNVDAAFAAAAHLPSNFRFHNKEGP
ncbi:MAG: phosphotransferase enzyme family protein [Ktedonobacteraceae bacterium]